MVRTVRRNVAIHDDPHAEFKAVAERNDRSFSGELRRIMRAHNEHEQQLHKSEAATANGGSAKTSGADGRREQE